MATARKSSNGKSKTVTNKNGSIRSYTKSAGKWKLCGYSGKAPKKRK